MTEPTSPHDASGPSSRYATGYHAPVLCKDVVEGLITKPGGLYVDATLGGGGHTAALLDALGAEGRVIGIDRDADALAEAEARLRAQLEAGRFQTLRGNFADLEGLLAEVSISAVDGLLLDLGVSSHQFDTPERGFSHRAEGALDMRMDQREGLTADDVINVWDESDLRELFYSFGEEPRARRIARVIVAARPLETTSALADVVRGAVPSRDEAKTLARIFQALRIAVNRELEALEAALEAAAHLVQEGGRVAVISYHSLEDRRVKRVFRHGNVEGVPVRDLYGNVLSPWREITRKPIRPSEEETKDNPRARSARLRLAERVATPLGGG